MTLANIQFNDFTEITNEMRGLILNSAKENMNKEAYNKFSSQFQGDLLPLNFSSNTFLSVENSQEFIAVIYENLGVDAANAVHEILNYAIA